MKFALTLFVSLLLAAFGVSPGSSKPHRLYPKGQPNAVSLRQHHIPRALLDTCIYVDASVIAQSGLLGLGLNLPLGLLTDINICLCLSALPLFLETDIRIQVLVDLLGKQRVAALLTALLNTGRGRQQCSYPSHSTALCKKGDPCGFECTPPYIKLGKYCLCPAPMQECNGICGNYPRGCGSALPVPRQNQPRSSHGSLTLKEAQATCTKKESVCGVYGSKGFECINVKSALESCGGCAISSPFSILDASPLGRDCTAIEGVELVTCDTGRCAVGICKPGYTVAPAGDACVASSAAVSAANPVVEDSDEVLSHDEANRAIAHIPAQELYRNADWRREGLNLGSLLGAGEIVQATASQSNPASLPTHSGTSFTKPEAFYRNADWKRASSRRRASAKFSRRK